MRYRLRTLLIVVTVCCICAAWLGYQQKVLRKSLEECMPVQRAEREPPRPPDETISEYRQLINQLN
jgi:hypothetical protein